MHYILTIYLKLWRAPFSGNLCLQKAIYNASALHPHPSLSHKTEYNITIGLNLAHL